MSVAYYNHHAQSLAEQYLSKDFTEVHSAWSDSLKDVLKNSNAKILDVGAGSGRDVCFIAEMAQNLHGESNQTQIIAVEPAEQLAVIGKSTTQNNANVKWYSDTLPAMEVISGLEISYDLILLSAVWMHIPASQRTRAIRKLSNLLKPGGRLIISLRHGQTDFDIHQREMHHVCADELQQLAKAQGLYCEHTTEYEHDQLGRGNVSWQTMVLRLPDDGTGAFPFIRHVALNDGKSATHKLALLRVLLRIADGHPGAVIRRESSLQGDRVILPAGLVGLYWCHQYKDLIDHHQLYQTPNSKPNMGFMKPDGWHKLTHRKGSDYRVGNLFTGDDAIALYKTISAAVRNIKEMPCNYITIPNSEQCVFEIESKSVRAKDSIFLDLLTLNQWGEFSLPESTWLAFSRYACWIEPVLVNEWVKTMASYRGNEAYHSPEQHFKLYNALAWLEPVRATNEARHRCEELKLQSPLNCVWSQKRLNQDYDIDHCLPFARWPNNDLWNLMPADSKVNLSKSDKLPSDAKLKSSESCIKSWWQQAWTESKTQKRFFAEANLALPGLSLVNSSLDDVFEALSLQRTRLRDMQQLSEWG